MTTKQVTIKKSSISHIAETLSNYELEGDQPTKLLIFKGDLLQNALFFNWFNTHTYNTDVEFWLPLKALYQDYETYVTELEQSPVSRHNHLVGLQTMKPKFEITIERRRDGFYVKGLKLRD